MSFSYGKPSGSKNGKLYSNTDDIPKGTKFRVEGMELSYPAPYGTSYILTDAQIAQGIVKWFKEFDGTEVKYLRFTKTPSQLKAIVHIQVMEGISGGLPIALIAAAIIAIAVGGAVIASMVVLPGVWYKLAGVSASQVMGYNVGQSIVWVCLGVGVVIAAVVGWIVYKKKGRLGSIEFGDVLHKLKKLI